MTSDLSEARINTLVDAFYKKVRLDPEIGPIFNAAVDDWPYHLALLKDFWSTVLLTTGRYKGDPAMRHVQLALDQQHFDRWLELFAETTQETFSPETAARVTEKARRIGRNFQDAAAYLKQK